MHEDRVNPWDKAKLRREGRDRDESQRRKGSPKDRRGSHGDKRGDKRGPARRPEPKSHGRPRSDGALDFYASCTRGVEPALVEELVEIGAEDIHVRPGGAAFAGDLSVGYRAVLWLRTAIRVMEVLTRGHVEHEAQLYEAVHAMPWENWMTVEDTLAVDASIRDSCMTHSGYVALRTKDAICDRFRARDGLRPSVDTAAPTLPIKVVLLGRELTVSRDLGGMSLHKRGYRPKQLISPLNESTAAGILRLVGWKPGRSLVDPMCGSGTFLIEAAAREADLAPGLGRRFAFESWPDVDTNLWDALVNDALEVAERRAARDRGAPTIWGSDRHKPAITMAKEAARAAGVSHAIAFEIADIRKAQPPFTPDFVVTNPPYGERLGEGEDLEETWFQLGHFLKTKCNGATANILCGAPELSRKLGMKTTERWPVKNGPIDCRVLQYAINPPGAARRIAKGRDLG